MWHTVGAAALAIIAPKVVDTVIESIGSFTESIIDDFDKFSLTDEISNLFEETPDIPSPKRSIKKTSIRDSNAFTASQYIFICKSRKAFLLCKAAPKLTLASVTSGKASTYNEIFG